MHIHKQTDRRYKLPQIPGTQWQQFLYNAGDHIVLQPTAAPHDTHFVLIFTLHVLSQVLSLHCYKFLSRNTALNQTLSSRFAQLLLTTLKSCSSNGRSSGNAMSGCSVRLPPTLVTLLASIFPN